MVAQVSPLSIEPSAQPPRAHLFHRKERPLTDTSKPEVFIEYRDLEDIIPADRNPKDHDIGAIIESIKRFGFVAPAILNESNGHLVVGHGRAEALLEMKKTKKKAPNRITVTEDGKWLVPILRGIEFRTDKEAEAYLLADNQLTILGGWHTEQLAEALKEFVAEEIPFEGTGFDKDDLDDILQDLNDDETDKSDGSLLDLTNIAIEEPRDVEKGSVWILSDKHTLLVVDVIKDWPIWKDYLSHSDSLFCPYPGPYVPLSDRAEDFHLIMIQPDPYIAGHILDRYEEIHGEGAVKQEGEK